MAAMLLACKGSWPSGARKANVVKSGLDASSCITINNEFNSLPGQKKDGD